MNQEIQYILKAATAFLNFIPVKEEQQYIYFYKCTPYLSTVWFLTGTDKPIRRPQGMMGLSALA